MFSLASFKVHLSVGLTASGIAATSVMVAGLASEEEVIAYILLGTLGSLLPDVDADNSTPVRFIFSFASICLAFAIMFFFAQRALSVMELVLIWFASYLVFRWFIFTLITRLTTHRGTFHSVPAAACFGFMTATVAHHLFAFQPLQAWMSGLFVFIGYMLHLTLDELYSVNLFGMRMRRSFGTALKLYSKNSQMAILIMYLFTLLLFFTTPTVTPLIRIASDAATYQEIHLRMWPQGTWFDLQVSR